MTPADRNKWILIGAGVILLLAVGSLVYWFLENHEQRERVVRTGASPEARSNPYLAAERYLSRLGYRAESVRGRSRLKSTPAQDGTLIVHNLGPSLPPGDERRLLDWVEQGAHLVLVPRRTWEEDGASARNHLFERFGIRLHRRVPEDVGSGAGIDPQAQDPEVVTVQRASAGGTSRRYQLAFDPALYLEDTASIARERAAGEHGAHLLAWKQGEGWITVFSDNGFMLNDQIGEHDHAWFLSDLVHQGDRVWFLADAAMPALTQILWRRAPETVLSAILLGLLWLWRSAATHGPRRRAGSRARRNIIEHLEAVAAFAWRRDPGRELVNQSRSVVERQWRRRHPRLNRMDEASRCAWIAAQAGLREEQVRSALYGIADDEQTLIRNTVLQQRLTGILVKRADIIEEQS